MAVRGGVIEEEWLAAGPTRVYTVRSCEMGVMFPRRVSAVHRPAAHARVGGRRAEALLPLRAPPCTSCLEFSSARRDQEIRSLLRVQLSSSSVLSFQPRGGGLKVIYRSQF